MVIIQSELSGVKLVIIDEMSMLSASQLGKVSKRLQDAFPSMKGVAFGGCSVFLFGDNGQLSPVGEKPLFDSNKGEANFNGEGARAYQLFNQSVVLTEMYRQSSDPEFAEMLNRLRDGATTFEDFLKFSNRQTSSYFY